MQCLHYLQGQEASQRIAINCLANMHCKHLEELKDAVEEYTAQLEGITINGTIPDEPKPASMAVLKDLLKDS